MIWDVVVSLSIIGLFIGETVYDNLFFMRFRIVQIYDGEQYKYVIEYCGWVFISRNIYYLCGLFNKAYFQTFYGKSKKKRNF